MTQINGIDLYFFSESIVVQPASTEQQLLLLLCLFSSPWLNKLCKLG